MDDLERVARAITSRELFGAFALCEILAADVVEEMGETLARAALKALMEPSADAVSEGLIGYGGTKLELRLTRGGITSAWQAMIRHILDGDAGYAPGEGRESPE